MTDMIERGKAKFREIALQYGWTETAGEDYAFVPAILLAALDPEDRDLARLVARHICTKVELGKFKDPDELEVVSEGGDKDPVWMAHIDEAIAAIEALKSIAQGETAP